MSPDADADLKQARTAQTREEYRSILDMVHLSPVTFQVALDTVDASPFKATFHKLSIDSPPRTTLVSE